MFGKKKKKCETTKFTIKSLVYSLQAMMTENPRLSWDSPVIISDLQMSGFKNNFKLYPVNDYENGTIKLGLFVLPNDLDSEFEEEPELEETTEDGFPELNDFPQMKKYGV